MTELDILRRKLLILGFGLLEVPGGYLIRSLYLENLKAGTEAAPLSLAQVGRFVA